ncbi:hypothetical protein BKA83DRAFT_1432810 [Pisolithus microcarpus]|nr:hypothetical protein BKA83DRAFT_1432810 [Pisolithus microcarpus]
MHNSAINLQVLILVFLAPTLHQVIRSGLSAGHCYLSKKSKSKPVRHPAHPHNSLFAQVKFPSWTENPLGYLPVPQRSLTK